MQEGQEVEPEAPEDHREEETEVEFYLWLLTKGLDTTYSGCKAVFELLDEKTRMQLIEEWQEEWG